MLRHSPVVIGGTICRKSRADGVVIYSTIRGIGVVIGSTVSRLLFTAQFGFAARGLLFPTQFKTVVIHGTFPLFAKKPGCYRRHNCVWGCYSRHNSAGLLNTAQLPPPAARQPFKFDAVSPVLLRRVVKHGTIPGVVIGGTFPLFCCCYRRHISFLGCYPRHNSKNVVIYSTVRKKRGCYSQHSLRRGLLDSAQLW